jgi:hypothetical protein
MTTATVVWLLITMYPVAGSYVGETWSVHATQKGCEDELTIFLRARNTPPISNDGISYRCESMKVQS